jgi:hypothetical protein
MQQIKLDAYMVPIGRYSAFRYQDSGKFCTPFCTIVVKENGLAGSVKGSPILPCTINIDQSFCFRRRINMMTPGFKPVKALIKAGGTGTEVGNGLQLPAANDSLHAVQHIPRNCRGGIVYVNAALNIENSTFFFCC